MRSARKRRVLTLSVLLIASAIAGAAGSATAGHGAENGNYTVDLPFDSDHLPGGQNEGNGSINHFAAGTHELFERGGAPDGFEGLKFIVISNPDIDFSGCGSTNTAAFGIDRGNNRSGTETDVSLLNYMERSRFNDHSIVVELYDGGEIAAPSDAPVHLNPEDEIVAHQGYQSQGGACYTMPSDPGWYQIDGMANGTTASGDHAQVEMVSHYFYICECNSEEEAYSTLGPPPGQDNPYDDSSDGGDESTPTATATPTTTATPVPESTDASTATATPEREPATPTDQPNADGAGGGDGSDDGGSGAGGDGGDASRPPPADTATADRRQGQPAADRTAGVPTTPTVAEGPGFGPAAALLALLSAALLALRRG